MGNGGILTAVESFHWELLDFYLILRRCGPRFLTPGEYAGAVRRVRAEYLRILGESALLRREPEFWTYHRRGLATVGEELPSPLGLAPQVARAALKAIVRPAWFRRERARLRGGTDQSASTTTASVDLA